MDPKNIRRTRFSIVYYLVAFGVMALLQVWLFSGFRTKEIPYNQFLAYLDSCRVQKVIMTQDRIFGRLRTEADVKRLKRGETCPTDQPVEMPIQGKTPWNLFKAEMEKEKTLQFSVTRLPGINEEFLIERFKATGVEYTGKIQNNWLSNFLFNWIVPFFFLFAIWGFLIKKVGGGSSGVLKIGKSNAKLYSLLSEHRVTFDDVAGVDEAVEEVKEVVTFLKSPQRYTRLGGKMPKGILLVGPPGTGKTLLAKAVAGEAGVPFFSMSGSDFVEMFVGVGAARVRDLFTEAKSKAPCIIFIDEIDAIGKSRAGAIAVGGHDEREQTLNQLLVEMDGFDASAGVVIFAATNRAEVLDKALLRPGRFDRQILVDRPDMQGRFQIFKVHTRSLKLAEDVDLKKLAAHTPGFAGAEIANVCNEAAILAAREGKESIHHIDFENAIERVIAGLEKKNKLINPFERKIVAYHESGHAIIGYFTPGADQVQKVSIVPRGMSALGYTLQMPLEDRYLMTRKELMGKLAGLLGGRVAEEIVFGDISTGASNDLERAAEIARNMVSVYGMSRKLPNISFHKTDQGNFLGFQGEERTTSDKVKEIIDEEIIELINSAYENAKTILQEKRKELDALANLLLDKEVVGIKELEEILGPLPEMKENIRTDKG